MKQRLDEYNKALKNVKIHNLEFFEHTINKEELLKAYKQYKKSINDICDIDKSDVDALIKYENWLLGD